MSSQIEVRRRGRVGLQLKACENASGVSGWAFEGNKWMDERARCQKHPTRMSDGGLGWRTCHLLAWFPLGCSHTHVSRWNYERKKLGGDWMNWTCWRQGQGEWRVKNKIAIRFLAFALLFTCIVGVIESEEQRGSWGGVERCPRWSGEPPNPLL